MYANRIRAPNSKVSLFDIKNANLKKIQAQSLDLYFLLRARFEIASTSKIEIVHLTNAAIATVRDLLQKDDKKFLLGILRAKERDLKPLIVSILTPGKYHGNRDRELEKLTDRYYSHIGIAIGIAIGSFLFANNMGLWADPVEKWSVETGTIMSDNRLYQSMNVGHSSVNVNGIAAWLIRSMSKGVDTNFSKMVMSPLVYRWGVAVWRYYIRDAVGCTPKIKLRAIDLDNVLNGMDSFKKLSDTDKKTIENRTEELRTSILSGNVDGVKLLKSLHKELNRELEYIVTETKTRHQIVNEFKGLVEREMKNKSFFLGEQRGKQQRKQSARGAEIFRSLLPPAKSLSHSQSKSSTAKSPRIQHISQDNGTSRERSSVTKSVKFQQKQKRQRPLTKVSKIITKESIMLLILIFLMFGFGTMFVFHDAIFGGAHEFSAHIRRTRVPF